MTIVSCVSMCEAAAADGGEQLAAAVSALGVEDDDAADVAVMTGANAAPVGAAASAASSATPASVVPAAVEFEGAGRLLTSATGDEADGSISCLLLQLPGDVLAAVCTHLSGYDVCRLALTSHVMSARMDATPGLWHGACSRCLRLQLSTGNRRPSATCAASGGIECRGPDSSSSSSSSTSVSSSSSSSSSTSVSSSTTALSHHCSADAACRAALFAYARLQPALASTCLRPYHHSLPPWAMPAAAQGERGMCDVTLSLPLALTPRQLYWLSLGFSTGQSHGAFWQSGYRYDRQAGRPCAGAVAVMLGGRLAARLVFDDAPSMEHMGLSMERPLGEQAAVDAAEVAAAVASASAPMETAAAAAQSGTKESKHVPRAPGLLREGERSLIRPRVYVSPRLDLSHLQGLPTSKCNQPQGQRQQHGSGRLPAAAAAPPQQPSVMLLQAGAYFGGGAQAAAPSAAGAAAGAAAPAATDGADDASDGGVDFEDDGANEDVSRAHGWPGLELDFTIVSVLRLLRCVVLSNRLRSTLTSRVLLVGVQPAAPPAAPSASTAVASTAAASAAGSAALPAARTSIPTSTTAGQQQAPTPQLVSDLSALAAVGYRIVDLAGMMVEGPSAVAAASNSTAGLGGSSSITSGTAATRLSRGEQAEVLKAAVDALHVTAPSAQLLVLPIILPSAGNRSGITGAASSNGASSRGKRTGSAGGSGSKSTSGSGAVPADLLRLNVPLLSGVRRQMAAALAAGAQAARRRHAADHAGTECSGSDIVPTPTARRNGSSSGGSSGGSHQDHPGAGDGSTLHDIGPWAMDTAEFSAGASAGAANASGYAAARAGAAACTGLQRIVLVCGDLKHMDAVRKMAATTLDRVNDCSGIS